VLAALGADPHLWSDLGTRWWRDCLPESLLLISVAGADSQLEVLAGLRAALRGGDAGPNDSILGPRFALHISSTGVYARAPRSAIGDDSALANSPRAQKLLEVERLFAASFAGSTCSLRAGGLYRAGRGPFPAFARRRTLPGSDLDQPIALIHYDDLAAAAVSVLEADGAINGAMAAFVEPVPVRGRFYFEAALRLGLSELAESLVGYRDAEVPVKGLRFADIVLQHPLHPHWQDALA
jgi:hypothetical protein